MNYISITFQDPIEIPRDLTASDLDPEHRLAYFREDIGINLHHWHWHVIYPTSGPSNVVNKDRRGELFYYMHQQIIARYKCLEIIGVKYSGKTDGNFISVFLHGARI